MSFFNRFRRNNPLINTLYSQLNDEEGTDSDAKVEYDKKLERSGFGIKFDKSKGTYVHLYLSDLINFFKSLNYKLMTHFVNDDRHIMVFAQPIEKSYTSYILVNSFVDEFKLKLKREDGSPVDGVFRLFRSEWELVDESCRQIIELENIEKIPDNKFKEQIENLINYHLYDTSWYIS